MESVLYAIPTSVPQPSYASAKSAVSETIKTNVSCVEVKVFQTLSIALNVQDWRRTAMDVRRLSIWVVVGRIYSIKKRIFGIISKAVDRGIVYYLCICIMVWSLGERVLDFDSSSYAGKNEASYIIASGALDGTGR